MQTTDYDKLEETYQSIIDASNYKQTLTLLEEYYKAKLATIYRSVNDEDDQEYLELMDFASGVQYTFVYRYDYGYAVYAYLDGYEDCKHIDMYSTVPQVDMMKLYREARNLGAYLTDEKRRHLED